MDLELTGRNFIISGSSRGIGKGIAQVLLEEGARVVLTGRDERSLNDTFHQFNSMFPGCVLKCCGDLTSEEILDELEEQVKSVWGELHGLVANAGAVKPIPEWDIEQDDWDWYFGANLFVATGFTRRFVPYLVETKGNIIVIGSIAGLEDIGAPLPYSASKVALTMYAKGLARKLAEYGIRVNTVAPGNVCFPGGNWDNKKKAAPERVSQMLEEKVPLKRFGTSEEIGHAAAFLLSNKASFVTGSCFVVDGGQTLLFS
jgi:3-oxoacyl-[acyl-carrier protein] reductase